MHERKHTMSFRFDPEPKPSSTNQAAEGTTPTNEEKSKPAEQEVKKEELELITWDKELLVTDYNESEPEDKETEEKTEQKPNTALPPEADEEEMEEHDFLPRPDQSRDQEKSPKEPFLSRVPDVKAKQKTRKFQALYEQVPWNVVTAVLSALVVGVGLAFAFYTLFVGANEAAEEQVTENEALTASSVEAAFPTLNVDIVQGGAFETVESGQEIADSVQEAGLPAVLTSGEEPFYLFVGIGNDHSQAQAISERIEAEGQDTYVKTYQVEGGTPEEGGEATAAWFVQAVDYFRGLTAVAANQASGNDAVISEAQKEEVRANGESLREQREGAFAELSEEAKDAALTMSDALAQAASLIEQEDNELVWEVQQHLLDAVMAYEQAMVTSS
ncbi:hypothetical protein [Shouchella shacheensis]|uniref:hypothetical protein n=1 Tax=Shouchella shacheensis TaxID=1649580 RepID=UPI0007403BB3|nr:hypothetical protein [Shouchella shacheensis]